jgi:hypothetical protein
MSDERQYVIETIGSFLNGSGGEWDWDDFTSSPLRSAKLDSIRLRADAVKLPLDADGTAVLEKLLYEADELTGDELTKSKPWRQTTGVVAGSLVGALLWWNNYIPGGGLFQNLRLILIPAAIGIFVVDMRNRR